MAKRKQIPKPVRPHTVEWAAEQLGVSVPIVYRLISAQKLRSYKVGKCRRISAAAVAECIRALEAETAAQVAA